MADDYEKVVRVIGKGLYLVEVGELSNVAIDELMARMAVIVAYLICSPSATVKRYPVVRKRSDEDSALKGQQLIDVEFVDLQLCFFGFLMLPKSTVKDFKSPIERIQISTDEVSNSDSAVLIRERRRR